MTLQASVTSETVNIQLVETKKEDAVPDDDYDYFIWTQREDPVDDLFQPLARDDDDELSMIDHRQIDIDGVIYDIPQSLLPRTLTQASGVYDKLEPIDPNKQLVLGGQIYDIPRKLLEEQNAIQLSVLVPEVRRSPVPSRGLLASQCDKDYVELDADTSSSKLSIVRLPKDVRQRGRSLTGPL